MFDMSGSGKSDGEFITYGIKESEDIGMYNFIKIPLFAFFIIKNTSVSLSSGGEAWEQSPLSPMHSKKEPNLSIKQDNAVI